ncbi:basement membrane-specific heparan sulfate proteoglycan core -like [Paramuricea clavata]|uniref:Basement membrane-specific heparan sulfate proteoglycan core -like n=1 Tax=Paramuricea clavata TaxID=317549 RepID=A0A7D9DWM7_PARCT|nr:basement membrane-specific heparan sulfate proteoglycan core -like [Paramuricea clavata]
MSGSSWYIIGAFVIILQQIVPVVLQKDVCRKREKFFSQYTVPKERNKSLSSFRLQCTAQPIVFEVRYKDKQLCVCGRITKANKPIFPNCPKRIPLDFTVVISAEKVRSQWADNCTFIFNFGGGAKTTLRLGILPVTLMTSHYVIAKTVTRTSVVTRLFTSYITSTIILNGTVEIGQPLATSSPMVSRSELRNSAPSSGQISSTMINPEPSQGPVLTVEHSEGFPFYTAIVITPTRNQSILQSTVLSIRQSPIPSILQSSDLVTPSLATESVMITSSWKESAVLKALSSIQASPTTPEVLPSSTLTPEDPLLESDILSGNTYYWRLLKMWIGGKTTWKLCWRATRDGWAAKTFHSNCDYKKRTVTLVKVGQYIFGGYATASWEVGKCPFPPAVAKCPPPVSLCSVDDDCPGSQKCCDDGCAGSDCLEPQGKYL